MSFKAEQIHLDDHQIWTIEKYCKTYFDPEENKKFSAHLTTREDANKVGIFGECAVGLYFGDPVDVTLGRRPIHQADAGFDIEINGKRWDIKTQVSNHAGKSLKEYYMNLPVSMLKKNPHGYIWVLKWKENWSTFWIMGWMEQIAFAKAARLHKAGDKMGEHFTYTADTLDIKVTKLWPISMMKR
jgi:hypothetical protein